MRKRQIALIVAIMMIISIVALSSMTYNDTNIVDSVQPNEHLEITPNDGGDISNKGINEYISPSEQPNNLIKSLDFDAEESEMLMKIAMAEAGGEGKECMALVMLTVLNRVWSESFPNNIHDVIYEQHGNTYQFTPIANGAYDRAIPSEECKEALNLIMNGWNESNNSLYFESCSGSSWHSRNLEFLYQSGNMRFYR